MLLKLKIAKYFSILSIFIVPLFANCNEEQKIQKYTMNAMKENALLDYALERDSLTLDQIYSILDQGIELASRTDMIVSLSEGGSALFPHTYMSKCGDQIAAVVHACLAACQKTGKNQILLIGVLHSLTDTLKDARKREIDGINILADQCRGIFGPGLPNENCCVKNFRLITSFFY